MRFCMITTFYPPHHFGGDAIFVYRLSHLLGDRGHDVEVFYSEDAFSALSQQPPAAGYPDHPAVRRVPLRSSLGKLDLLAVQQTGRPFRHRTVLEQVFEPGRYDVIHFHNVSLMGAPALLARAAETDAVSLYTLHEHWLVCPMHVLWRYDREPCETQTCIRCQVKGRRPPQLWRYTGLRDRAVQAVDAFLAPSRFTLRKHAELGFKEVPRLLPHFVLEPAQASEGPLPADHPYFLFAGRLERLKGADTLIQAFRGLPEANLVIAGDGNDRARLEELAQGLANVRFVGRLSPTELGRYYRHARAALVPSLCYEVFGLTAVEAFACGTPAVVRDRGSLTELIEDSGAGFAYRTEDELLSALRSLLSNDELRQQMSQRARAAYFARWTPDVHLGGYFQIIDELRAAKRPKQAERSSR